MTVKVKLFATLSERSGKDEVEIEADKVRAALTELEKTCPFLIGKLFKDTDKEELKNTITVIKDGRNITYLEGLDTELGNGDELSIFPPVGGG